MIDAHLQLHRGNFSLSVELEIPEGITGIFGPSGSGKTSLLRAIAGLDRHLGHVRWNDQVWQDEVTFLPPHCRSVGFVFQEPSLFPHLTIEGNLAYAHRRSRKMAAEDSLRLIIDLLELSPFLSRLPKELSGGEQQRAALARALASQPQLLLLDEPFTGWDTRRKEQFLPYLKEIHEEFHLPMLYVSHSREEIESLCHHLVGLSDTGIKAGPLAQIFSPSSAREELAAITKRALRLSSEDRALLAAKLLESKDDSSAPESAVQHHSEEDGKGPSGGHHQTS